MKTEISSRGLDSEKTDLKSSLENRPQRAGVRRTLRPLQEAAGDKENLVGAGREMKEVMTPGKEVTIVVPEASTSIKKKRPPPVVTVEDLTSEENPSEGYWEILAERRRKALEEALIENEDLHNRVAALIEENEKFKVIIEEHKALIEVLKEVLNEENAEEVTEDTKED